MNVAPRPVSWAFVSVLCFSTKIIFKLTIDISMCKIILEVEYFVKSTIYQMFAEMILRPLFWFKDTKNTG